jgi:FG-GAP repeat/Tyrosine-protein kinase ephrin type A/B receptor-like
VNFKENNLLYYIHNPTIMMRINMPKLAAVLLIILLTITFIDVYHLIHYLPNNAAVHSVCQSQRPLTESLLQQLQTQSQTHVSHNNNINCYSFYVAGAAVATGQVSINSTLGVHDAFVIQNFGSSKHDYAFGVLAQPRQQLTRSTRSTGTQSQSGTMAQTLYVGGSTNHVDGPTDVASGFVRQLSVINAPHQISPVYTWSQTTIATHTIKQTDPVIGGIPRLPYVSIAAAAAAESDDMIDIDGTHYSNSNRSIFMLMRSTNVNPIVPGQAQGSNDIVLMKVSVNDGQQQFVIQRGSAESDIGYDIAVAIESESESQSNDANANANANANTWSNTMIYVVGHTQGELFRNRTSGSLPEYFVWKFDDQGNTIWGVQSNHSTTDSLYSVAVVSRHHSIVACGATRGNIGVNYINAGGLDMYCAMFHSTSSELQWEMLVGSPQDEYITGVTVDQDSDSIFCTGNTGGQIGDTINAGRSDIVVMKLQSSSGTIVWKKQIGGAGGDFATRIHFSAATHSVAIAGATSSDLIGDTQTQLSTSAIAVLQFDATSGSNILAYVMDGDADDHAFGIDTDQSGNIYVVGWTLSTLSRPTSYYDGFVLGLQICPAGALCADTHTILSCPAGSYCPAGSKTAILCPSTYGTYCPTNSSAPQSCPIFSYCPTPSSEPIPVSSGYSTPMVVVRNVSTQIGSSSNDQVWGMAIDPSSSSSSSASSPSILIAGRTEGAISQAVSNQGAIDVFAMKLDSNGDVQWSYQIGTTESDSVWGMCVDNDGNSYLAGNSPGNLGAPPVGGSNPDIFVIKLNTTGHQQWIYRQGTSASDGFEDITFFDTQNALYATGYSNGDFAQTNAGPYDLIVVKFDADTTAEHWRWQLGTSGYDIGKSISVDASSGSCYIAGWQTQPAASLGIGDLLAVKLNSTGSEMWSFRSGTNVNDRFQGSVLYQTHFFAVGSTSGAIGSVANKGASDAIVYKLDASTGSAAWAVQFGTAGNDVAYSVCIEQSTSHIFVAGTVSSVFVSKHYGSDDAFVAKLDQAGKILWKYQQGTAQQDAFKTILFDQSTRRFIASGWSSGTFSRPTSGGSDIIVSAFTECSTTGSYIGCPGLRDANQMLPVATLYDTDPTFDPPFAAVDTIYASSNGDTMFSHTVHANGYLVATGVPQWNSNTGRVLIFELAPGSPRNTSLQLSTGLAWHQVAVLTAPDGQPTDKFGSNIVIDGDTVFVYAGIDWGSVSCGGQRRGTVYTFERNITAERLDTHSQSGTGSNSKSMRFDFLNKLQNPQSVDDRYGEQIAIEGELAIIGAPFDNAGPAGCHSGAAFVYTRGIVSAKPTWSLKQTLISPSPQGGENFATAIAIYRNVVVIGVNQVNALTGSDDGCVYVYRRDMSSNVLTGVSGRITSPLPIVSGFFGNSIGLAPLLVSGRAAHANDSLLMTVSGRANFDQVTPSVGFFTFLVSPVTYVVSQVTSASYTLAPLETCQPSCSSTHDMVVHKQVGNRVIIGLLRAPDSGLRLYSYSNGTGTWTLDSKIYSPRARPGSTLNGLSVGFTSEFLAAAPWGETAASSVYVFDIVGTSSQEATLVKIGQPIPLACAQLQLTAADSGFSGTLAPPDTTINDFVGTNQQASELHWLVPIQLAPHTCSLSNATFGDAIPTSRMFFEARPLDSAISDPDATPCTLSTCFNTLEQNKYRVALQASIATASNMPSQCTPIRGNDHSPLVVSVIDSGGTVLEQMSFLGEVLGQWPNFEYASFGFDTSNVQSENSLSVGLIIQFSDSITSVYNIPCSFAVLVDNVHVYRPASLQPDTVVGVSTHATVQFDPLSNDDWRDVTNMTLESFSTPSYGNLSRTNMQSSILTYTFGFADPLRVSSTTVTYTVRDEYGYTQTSDITFELSPDFVQANYLTSDISSQTNFDWSDSVQNGNAALVPLVGSTMPFGNRIFATIPFELASNSEVIWNTAPSYYNDATSTLRVYDNDNDNDRELRVRDSVTVLSGSGPGPGTIQSKTYHADSSPGPMAYRYRDTQSVSTSHSDSVSTFNFKSAMSSTSTSNFNRLRQSRALHVDVGKPSIRNVYLLVTNFWGKIGTTAGNITLSFKNAQSHSVQLINGKNVRHYNPDIISDSPFARSVTDQMVTKSVWKSGVHLDLLRVSIPAHLWRYELQQVSVYDQGDRESSALVVVGITSDSRRDITFVPGSLRGDMNTPVPLQLATSEIVVQIPRATSSTDTQWISFGVEAGIDVVDMLNKGELAVGAGREGTFGDSSPFWVPSASCSNIAVLAWNSSSLKGAFACQLDRVSIGTLTLAFYDANDVVPPVSLWSVLSQDTLEFSSPQVISGSLRHYGDSQSGSDAMGAVTARTTTSERLQFDVIGFVMSPYAVSVQYDADQASTVALCSVVPELSNSTLFVCDTTAGVQGSHLEFRVLVDGVQLAVSPGSYSYAANPSVISVSGCSASASNPNSTVNCPTQSERQPLIIRGLQLEGSTKDQTTVRIGPTRANVLSVSAAELRVELPSGCGNAQPIHVETIKSNLRVESVPQYLVSYAKANVTRVLSRDPKCRGTSQDPRKLTGCSRDGGYELQLLGKNLGPYGCTRVKVGGVECPLIALSSGQNPHETLLCQVPPGVSELSVISIEVGSNLDSIVAGSYGYEGCGRGLYIRGRQCVSCPAGKYSNLQAAASCTDCEVGRYAPTTRRTFCIQCPGGEFSNTTGASSCHRCSAGRFSAVAGDSCSLCPPGRFANSSLTTSSECQPCAQNQYQSSFGKSQCQSCPAWTFSDEVGVAECSSCPSGRFLSGIMPTAAAAATASGSDAIMMATCSPCPPEVRCSPRSQPQALTGFWVSRTLPSDAAAPGAASDLSTRRCGYSRCVDSRACEASDSASTSSHTNNYTSTTLQVFSCCGSNRLPANENPLCGRCLSGYTEWNNECVQCDSVNGGLVFLVIILIWVYSIVIIRLSQTSSQSGKVMFYFMQMTLIVFADSLFQISVLGIVDFAPLRATGSSCIGPISALGSLTLRALMPLFCFAIIGLTAGLHFLARTHQPKYARLLEHYLIKADYDHSLKRRATAAATAATAATDYDAAVSSTVTVTSRASEAVTVAVSTRHSIAESDAIKTSKPVTWSRIKDSYYRACVGLALYGYNQITNSTVQFLTCVDVDGISVVSAEPSIDCNSNEYTAASALFYLLLVLVVIGMPFGLLVGFILARRRSYINNKHLHPRFHRIFGLLYSGQRKQVLMWQVVILCRRAAFLVVFNLTVLESHPIRYMSVTIVNIIVLLLHVLVQPYVQRVVNIFETLLLTLLTVFTASMTATPFPLSTAAQVGYSVMVWVTFALSIVYYANGSYRSKAWVYHVWLWAGMQCRNCYNCCTHQQQRDIDNVQEKSSRSSTVSQSRPDGPRPRPGPGPGPELGDDYDDGVHRNGGIHHYIDGDTARDGTSDSTVASPLGQDEVELAYEISTIGTSSQQWLTPPELGEEKVTSRAPESQSDIVVDDDVCDVGHGTWQEMEMYSEPRQLPSGSTQTESGNCYRAEQDNHI